MNAPLDNLASLPFGLHFGQIYPAGFGVLTGSQHLGTDWIVPTGTPVYAPLDGVAYIKTSSQTGVCIEIQGEQYWCRMMHLRNIVKTSTVKAGNLVAYSDNTGLSSGAHLHVDFRKPGSSLNIANFFDPEKLLATPQEDTITQNQFTALALPEALTYWESHHPGQQPIVSQVEAQLRQVYLGTLDYTILLDEWRKGL